MARRYYAKYNGRFGIDVSYDASGWQFLAFKSKAARDAFVSDHVWDYRGRILSGKINRCDIPIIHKSRVAIVKYYNSGYPAGCIGEVGICDCDEEFVDSI